jgi:hypothetical protein
MWISAVWRSGSLGDAFAEGLETAHLGLGAAADVVSRPPFPERPAVVTRGALGFVARPAGWAILSPLPTVHADRDYWRATARDDGAVAAAGVLGAICGHGAGVFVLGDLVAQVRQDGAVAFAVGDELDRADVGCSGVHGQMDLAPLASPLNTMLSGLPPAITEELAAGAVYQPVQRPVGTEIRDLHLETSAGDTAWSNR